MFKVLKKIKIFFSKSARDKYEASQSYGIEKIIRIDGVSVRVGRCTTGTSGRAPFRRNAPWAPDSCHSRCRALESRFPQSRRGACGGGTPRIPRNGPSVGVVRARYAAPRGRFFPR